MRMTMKDAMNRAKGNKDSWGGEWLVWKDGNQLTIQMISSFGNEPPTPDALIIYRTDDRSGEG